MNHLIENCNPGKLAVCRELQSLGLGPLRLQSGRSDSLLIRASFSPALGAVGSPKLRKTAPISGGLERPTVTENHTESAGQGEMRVVLTLEGDQGRLHGAGGI